MNIKTKTKKSISPNQAKVNSPTAKSYITNTGEILVDKTKKGKDKKWAKKKSQSLHVADIFAKAREQNKEVISASALDNIRHCSEVLTFKVQTETGERTLNEIYTCKSKFCPICASRRSTLLRNQTMKVVDKILEEDPTTRFIFLTLTTENVPGSDIGKEVDHFVKSLQRIFSKGNGAIKESAKLRSSVLGTMRHIEVTYSIQRDDYHVHAHVIIAVKDSYFSSENYLTQKDYQELWKKAAKLDYNPIVHVKAIHGKGKVLESAVAETAKYATKMSNILCLPEEKAVEVLSYMQVGLFNRRLVGHTGTFYKLRRELKLEDIETADLLKIDDEEEEKGGTFEYHVFRWSFSLKEYICLPHQVVKSLDEEYFREKRREKILKIYGLAG